MFPRIRRAFGIALLLTLITVITAYAKGGFSFITITGSNLKDVVRVTDPELTTDFFAFADFYRDRAKAPADPGTSYEIRRYYIDGRREIAFDRLHYYPDTGFVFYDGIVNGSSEYDGAWYTAKPKIKAVFDNALSLQANSASSKVESQPSPLATQSQSFMPIAVVAGLAALLIIAFWLRKPSTQ